MVKLRPSAHYRTKIVPSGVLMVCWCLSAAHIGWKQRMKPRLVSRHTVTVFSWTCIYMYIYIYLCPYLMFLWHSKQQISDFFWIRLKPLSCILNQMCTMFFPPRLLRLHEVLEEVERGEIKCKQWIKQAFFPLIFLIPLSLDHNFISSGCTTSELTLKFMREASKLTLHASGSLQGLRPDSDSDCEQHKKKKPSGF